MFRLNGSGSGNGVREDGLGIGAFGSGNRVYIGLRVYRGHGYLLLVCPLCPNGPDVEQNKPALNPKTAKP